MKKIRHIIAASLAVASLLTMSIGSSFAVSTTSSGNLPSNTNGMKISPVRTDLTIDPGSRKVVQVVVENVTDSTENLQALVNDFIANPNESGAPSLLLNGAKAPQHGLKQYITPIPNVTIAPHTSVNVDVTIVIPANAAGGGYFGAVRFQPAGADNSKQVNLSGSVGSLILVRVPGNVTEKMNIASLSIEQNGHSHSIFRNSKSLQAVVRFQNTGNVQEQPFGKVVVKKGKTVLSTAEVNNIEPRGNVLPDSIRRFQVPLKGVGSFGKYTVEGNFGFGSNGQLLSAKTTFYVLPLAVIIAAVVILVVLIFLAFSVPRIIRSHDQRILRRAGRR